MPQIIINEALCTKCNICSTVCILNIIKKATGSSFPVMPETNIKDCFACGHCESFCPQKALTLDFRLKEKESATYSEGQIGPQELSSYIKRRRSIRYYSSKTIPKELIAQVLDVTRYAPSGGNSQTVRWTVFQDPSDVRQIAALTVDWMRAIQGTSHPMAGYVLPMVQSWDKGVDSVCRNAPHLLIAHVPCTDKGFDPTDAIIALTHFDITAPSFGIGTCWAGFVKMAADQHKPLKDFLALPPDRRIAYAMTFGYPSFKPKSIPRRNPIKITWR